MTGYQVYQAVVALLTESGKLPGYLPRDVFVSVLNSTMQEANTKVALYVARDVRWATRASQRAYRILFADSSALTVKRVIRAICMPAAARAYDLLLVPSWQFEAKSATTFVETQTSQPKHLWWEHEEVGASTMPGQTPTTEQVFYVDPLPDMAYTISMTCHLPLPLYEDWFARLPVRLDAHEAIVSGVMANLFTMRSFHDNALKQMFAQKFQRELTLLSRQDNRLIVPPVQDHSDISYVQVE